MSEEPKTLHQVTAALAGVIGDKMFPKGDLAELRRMRTHAPPAAYWRLLMARIPEHLRGNERLERAWAMVMQGMAIMAPDIHSPKTLLGEAMSRVGGDPAESRLWTLLRSRDEQLEDQIRLVARYLAAHEQRVDWTSLAGLLFAKDEEDRDRICRRLARSYYRRTEPEAAESAAPAGTENSEE